MQEVIKNRRSVRNFLEKEVDKDLVLEIIDSARYAPFGGPPIKECQAWNFIIIKDKEVKERLSHSFKSRDAENFLNAPVVIAVVMAKTDQRYKDWDVVAGLAIENILLTIEEKGLGGFFMTSYSHNEEHIHDREELIKNLGIPNEDFELIAFIPLGYPDPEEIIPDKELKELKDMIHFDVWNSQNNI